VVEYDKMIIMIDLVLTSGSKETCLAENKAKRYKGGHMSTNVRVYVEKSIEREEGFKPGDKDGAARFCGSILIRDKSLYYTSVFDLEDRLPKSLKDYLHHISVWAHFSQTPYREQGIYKRGDVRAKLELVSTTRESRYELEMKGKSIKQLRNTYEAIRAGTLRPTISFEGNQQGKSKHELEVEVDQLQSTVATFKDRFVHVASAYEKVINAELAISHKVKGRRKEQDVLREITNLIRLARQDLIRADIATGEIL